MAKEQQAIAPGKKEKKNTSGHENGTTEAGPVSAKKIKEKKVLKKIEDFNKFTRLRLIKEAKVKKGLTEKLQIDSVQILKAIKCLQSFLKESKEKSKFLLEDEDEFLYLELTFSKLPSEYSIRPYQM